MPEGPLEAAASLAVVRPDTAVADSLAEEACRDNHREPCPVASAADTPVAAAGMPAEEGSQVPEACRDNRLEPFLAAFAANSRVGNLVEAAVVPYAVAFAAAWAAPVVVAQHAAQDAATDQDKQMIARANRSECFV